MPALSLTSHVATVTWLGRVADRGQRLASEAMGAQPAWAGLAPKGA